MGEPIESQQTSFSEFYHYQAPKIRAGESSNSGENNNVFDENRSYPSSESSNGLSDLSGHKFKQENGSYLLGTIKRKQTNKKEY